jgi:hypothetical protein
MNTQQQSENNKIDINNMLKILALFDLGPPELEETDRSHSPAEEIVADLSAASLFEEQDDELFALKHTQETLALYSREEEAAENIKIPRKRLKTFHEHPIPEPMDTCTSDSSEKWIYSCCAGCVFTDGEIPLQYCRRAYPDRVIDDNSDEEREIDEYDPNRMFRPDTVEEEDEEDEYLTEIWILEQEAKRRYPKRADIVNDKNEMDQEANRSYFKRADTVSDENEMELWFLEQEANRRYPGRTRPEGLEEIAVRLFEDELIMPILDDKECIPEMPVLRRQNTQFTVNGVTVYNGNPNGSRFFDNDLL